MRSFTLSLIISCVIPLGSASSQGAQDELLQSLLQRLGSGNRQYVEFGFDSNEHCAGGGGSNTCVLARDHGWTGLLMDGGHENASINLHREFITSTNIARLLRKHRVPTHVAYMSVDIDSAEVWVLTTIFDAGYRPRLLSVEYNSHFPWSAAITLPDPETMPSNLTHWLKGTCAYGASARAVALVAQRYDYVPIALIPGLDLFFTPRDLAAERSLTPIDLSTARLELHFHRPLPQWAADELVDYEAWLLYAPPLLEGAAGAAAGAGGAVEGGGTSERAVATGRPAQHARAKAAAAQQLASLAAQRALRKGFTCAHSPEVCEKALPSVARGGRRTGQTCFDHLRVAGGKRSHQQLSL